MARQHLAAGCDVQEATAPASHAGLGVPRVIVGHHGVDHEYALQTLRGLRHHFCRPLELRPGRHEGGPVRECPAVVLNLGHFDAAGADLHGQIQDLFEAVDVPAVHDRVQRERDPRFANPPGRQQFFGVGPRSSGDAVALFAAGVLEAELHVLESRAAERIHHRGVEENTRGDQVRVQADAGRVPHERHEVRVRRGLTAREMHL